MSALVFTTAAIPDALALARYLALLGICVSFSAYELATLQPASASPSRQQPVVFWWKKKQDTLVTDIQHNLNRCIGLDRRFEQLEQRKQGKQSIYEGILLIRERKQIPEE